ncbi:type II toxin-antitoxin system HicB family antitoxin [Photobacterium rosenbergii]|uniref:type II toxin-antitoxin system HicB family antitoxin n=1 Tax=Photobacterium rosenbergii TaxID=294936 RepID=UPI001304FC4F
MKYPIVITVGQNESPHGICFPDFAWCFSAAETIQDIIPKAKMTLQKHVDCMKSSGMKIPPPSKLSCLTDQGQYSNPSTLFALIEVDI